MRLNLTTPRSSFGWPADSARSRPALAISICRHGSMMMRARNGEMDAIRSGAFSLKNTHIYIYIRAIKLLGWPHKIWPVSKSHYSQKHDETGLRTGADLDILIFCLFEKWASTWTKTFKHRQICTCIWRFSLQIRNYGLLHYYANWK